MSMLGGQDSNFDYEMESTDGRPERRTMTCKVCAWTVTRKGLIAVVQAAQAHQRETGHQVNYSGIVRV